MTAPQKYVKKPVVIEAIQWTGDNGYEIMAWVNGSARGDFSLEHFNPETDPIASVRNDYVYLETLEGMMKAKVGDFIIRGVEGEFYPCKADIFHRTYETVDDSPISEEEREQIAKRLRSFEERHR